MHSEYKLHKDINVYCSNRTNVFSMKRLIIQTISEHRKSCSERERVAYSSQ